MSFFLGALFIAWIVTRLALFLTTRMKRTTSRLLITHCGSLGVMAILAGFGMADGGEPRFEEAFVRYLLPVLLLFVVDTWLQKRERRESPRAPGMTSERNGGGILEAVPASPVGREHSALDDLLAAAERYRATLREGEEQQYRAHNATIAGAQQQVTRAKEFVQRAGLDRALIRIMDTVKHWPSWSKRPDFPNYCIPGVEYVDEESESERTNGERRSATFVSIVFEGRPYSVEFDREGYFESGAFATLRFYDGQHLVVTLSLAEDLDGSHDGGYRDWRMLNVKSLDPGEWIQGVLALEKRIRMHSEGERYRREEERLLEQARHLPPV